MSESPKPISESGRATISSDESVIEKFRTVSAKLYNALWCFCSPKRGAFDADVLSKKLGPKALADYEEFIGWFGEHCLNTSSPESVRGKTLGVARPPQIAPKVALRLTWIDEKGRRASQYLTDEITEEQAAAVVAHVEEAKAAAVAGRDEQLENFSSGLADALKQRDDAWALIANLRGALEEIVKDAPVDEPDCDYSCMDNSGDIAKVASDSTHYYYAQIAREALNNKGQ